MACCTDPNPPRLNLQASEPKFRCPWRETARGAARASCNASPTDEIVVTVQRAKHAASQQHLKRVRRMLEFGSLIAAIMGLCRGAFFALRADWPVVGLDLATMALSVACFVLVRRNRLREASFLYVFVIYALIALSAVFIDLPTSHVPRSVHLFLPGLAVCACLLFLQERAWIRYGIPVVCLLTFALLNVPSDRVVAAGHELPDTLRVVGVWVNEAFALICLFGSVIVIQADVAERNGMEQELRNALIRGELLLHYQPQIGEGGELIGAEALVRWKHPVRGLVPPNDFIPSAEACGLMPALGDWVMRAACLQLVRWQAHSATCALTLAVNVSASQFAEPNFVEGVLEVLRDTGASPALRKLELTESALAEDIDDVVAEMWCLKAHGVRFSLDDFGTGFSSLSYLQKLPLDQLKIDQSFVRNLQRSDEDESIAKAVVALGNSLGLDVIAEGVETVEHRDLLAEIGCMTYQGYFFSKPLPIAQFESFAVGLADAVAAAGTSAAAAT